ncbi:hypothetical protein [Arthrobacter sp. Leaf69]|uniref:hypothetical protein n=1 Tax=Arthrobacter sp. Leaf69 TaxID=1736232 RepID=UPI000A6EFE93|nr:hypothetical protein [Arthrobacter sp. Leaf69]
MAPASPQAQRQRGRATALLSKWSSRARSSRIPFRVGQVLIGDDPFNGRRLGTVAVIEAPFVGLRTAGNTPEDVLFYDYRQLRFPD